MARFSSRSLLFALVAAILATSSPSVHAHSIFKKVMGKKFPGLTIKCEVCHADKKDRTVYNDFGKLFLEEFKGQDLSEKWSELEGDEKKEFEKKTMTDSLNAAWEVIKDKTNEDGKTWFEILDTAAIENVKLKRGKSKGTEGLGEESDEEDDEDDDDEEDSKDKGDDSKEKKDGIRPMKD